MTVTREQKPGVGRLRVVRVDEFEFELSDGRVYPPSQSFKTTMTVGLDDYEAELVGDMISLMSSFSSKIYGKRSHLRVVGGGTSEIS